MSKSARVWGWGDKFEDVKTNCEKYVAKRWTENTKECCLGIMARERNEGIFYFIDVYTGDSKSVGSLAEGLFQVALSQGETKVDFVTIRLYDDIISKNIRHCKSIEEIEKEFKKHEEAIVSRFINDPRVCNAAKGKNVIFIPETHLLCELKSKVCNKVIVETICDLGFETLRDFLYSLSDKIIKKNLAEEVIGYELRGSVEEFKINDVDVGCDEVYVYLGLNQD
ncbi:MAG: hypothetical protein QXI42_09470 [Thermoproteota archaeon]|nr:hypothetical protein [Candidatus Brockarchaeota archaeon]